MTGDFALERTSRQPNGAGALQTRGPAMHSAERSWVYRFSVTVWPTTRIAEARDAELAISAIRASITELCTDDHRDEPAILENWLGNKTLEQFSTWLARPTLHTVVAELGRVICGVGMLSAEGTVRLCYVHPRHTRCGVGRALMDAMEAHARALGLTRLQLDSTHNARVFYEALGFRRSGPPAERAGSSTSHPYEKSL